MALFSRVTTWVSNQVLTASALNGEFNNILNNAQASSYIGYSANVGQMQTQVSPGGVGTESLAGSIADELQRLRFIQAYTLGTTYWYDQTSRNLGAGNLAVQTADIAATAVTTAKIANGAVGTTQLANSSVTAAKKAALNLVTSSSSASFSTASGSYVDVVTASSITTNGRQVAIVLAPDGTGSASSLRLTSATGAACECNFKLLRGASTVAIWNNYVQGNGVTTRMDLPVSTLTMVDQPSAAAYTYKLQAQLVSGDTLLVNNASLNVYEL